MIVLGSLSYCVPAANMNINASPLGVGIDSQFLNPASPIEWSDTRPGQGWSPA